MRLIEMEVFSLTFVITKNGVSPSSPPLALVYDAHQTMMMSAKAICLKVTRLGMSGYQLMYNGGIDQGNAIQVLHSGSRDRPQPRTAPQRRT